jgi:transcription termination/antitermination protein NusG
MAEIQWYVIRAVSGQEKKIKSYIDNEIIRQKLEEVIPQVLIPSEKVYEMRNGKKRVREKSFFPGYIMISADLTNNRALDMILNMPGVLGFPWKLANRYEHQNPRSTSAIRSQPHSRSGK